MESDQYAYPSLPCFLAIFGQIFFSPIMEHCILGGHLYIFNFSVSGPIRKQTIACSISPSRVKFLNDD